MTKSLMIIAMAAPLMFAAQTPANPPASTAGQSGTTQTTTKTKKHSKKKSTTKKEGTGASASKPSANVAAKPAK